MGWGYGSVAEFLPVKQKLWALPSALKEKTKTTENYIQSHRRKCLQEHETKMSTVKYFGYGKT